MTICKWRYQCIVYKYIFSVSKCGGMVGPKINAGLYFVHDHMKTVGIFYNMTIENDLLFSADTVPLKSILFFIGVLLMLFSADVHAGRSVSTIKSDILLTAKSFEGLGDPDFSKQKKIECFS